MSEPKERKRDAWLIGLAGFVTATVAVWVWAFVAHVERLGDAGMLGDSFGPVAGIANAIALVVALRALALQREELRLQRDEMQEARQEMARQRKQLQRSAKAQEALAKAQLLAAKAQQAASVAAFDSALVSLNAALSEPRKIIDLQGIEVSDTVGARGARQRLEAMVVGIVERAQAATKLAEQISELGEDNAS